MRIPPWISTHLAAVRALAVFTVLLGIIYPLAITGIAHLPWLNDRADGSLLKVDGAVVGSRLIGQAFTDDDGNALPQYFQSRPSAAGDGYDPDATSASNLGPENVVDTLGEDGTQSLLTQVCARSMAIGELENVDGSRPYCTSDGVGAVLSVFHENGLEGKVIRAVSVNQACPTTPFVREYQGVTVECAERGQDYSGGVITPIRGSAPDNPAVPADAVTASGSGLDPHISKEYAELQTPRIATQRNISVDTVEDLVKKHTTDRALGFMGQPAVNVLELNIALDKMR